MKSEEGVVFRVLYEKNPQRSGRTSVPLRRV
jgi:hypothetical protein